MKTDDEVFKIAAEHGTVIRTHDPSVTSTGYIFEQPELLAFARALMKVEKIEDLEPSIRNCRMNDTRYWDPYEAAIVLEAARRYNAMAGV